MYARKAASGSLQAITFWKESSAGWQFWIFRECWSLTNWSNQVFCSSTREYY